MFTLNCKGRLLVISKPIVMGIINITPDSFFAGSRKQQLDDVLKQADKMINEGASILDIGAQSTTPNSEWIDASTEWNRLSNILPELTKNFPDTFFSIDSFHHEVARNAVNEGVSIVNDVSGGLLDADMIPTVASLDVPYICMHMKGRPQTMQMMASYENITLELIDYFIERIRVCQDAGIKDLIIDPGFGFAKNISQNFELMRRLPLLEVLSCPILVGISRKSTIYKTLGITPSEALNGTTVMNTIALMHGASILRVHDVKEAMEAIKLVQALGVD